MFSSLPSASKIYVSSAKSRQKNLNSAKKKRKKPVPIVCTPVRVCDEETLVSAISLRKGAGSHVSLTSNEESFEVEYSSRSEEDVPNLSVDIITEENALNTRIMAPSCVENAIIESTSESVCSDLTPNKTECIKSKTERRKPGDKNILIKEATSAVSDSIYCDEKKVDELVETSENSDVESSESMLETVALKSNLIKKDASCETTGSMIDIKAEVNATSSILLMQTANSDYHQPSDNNQKLNLIPQNEIHNVECKDHSDGNNGDISVHNKDHTSCIKSPTACEDLDCSENGVLVENPCTFVYEDTDATGDKISSDVDSSSVRSDCCTATNLYDIHVDNSEHESVEENQIPNENNGRLHSPEQSEVSCTESIMYEAKSIYQTDPSFQNHSFRNEQFHKKHISSRSGEEAMSSLKDLLENDVTDGCTNLQKVSSEKVLRRSFSVPEKFCDAKDIEALGGKISKNASHTQQRDFNGCECKSTSSCFTLDKSTFTADGSVITYDKCTITTDMMNPSLFKMDAATTPIKTGSETSSSESDLVSAALKESAMLFMRVLPPVAVMQARARSYVFGSIGAKGSLLGSEELSRFFPDNKVTVFVGTWNMNGRDPPDCIDDFLLPLNVPSVPDIYAVGIQESMQSRSEWEILLQTTLGPSHVLFASTTFGVLHLSIFMRRDLIWFCSEPEEANIATRPGSMIKTKGAVAICFLFFGTSFLFVNSHLTAHEQKLKERLSDYEKICSTLDLPKQIPLKPHQRGKDVTSRFDCVFWCGDLNFRVVQDRPSVLSFLEDKIRRPEPSCNLLMKHDQLTQAMAKGAVFQGFNEGVINFIPSYKFDVGTNCFDSAKQRVPSYTDRILYRSKDKSSVVCLHYDSVPDIFTSDHKPVFAVFKVSVKPGRDNVPLAAGLFKRDIYLEAIKRRAQQLEVSANHKQSTICNVM